MVHASLTGGVARHAFPVGFGAISDGSSGTYIVADALVHVLVVSAVVADEVFSTGKTSSRATLALVTESSEALVAASLADISLEKKRLNTLVAHSRRGATLASGGTGHTVSSAINVVLGRADTLVVNSLGK